MDLKKYSKYLSKELYQMISDIEKGIGIEVTELPPKNLMPIGARFILKKNGEVKEYIKLNDGEYHLISGGSAEGIELRKTDTHIQWKNTGSEIWNDLIALNELKGEQGEQGQAGQDGREIELRVNTETQYIQWKYTTDTGWTNLIALSELKGDEGQSINHISFTSTTAQSGLPNEPGETDTYTVWGDEEETINLGTFNVYNGEDGNGVPSGGMTSQVLAKKSNLDYDTEWKDNRLDLLSDVQIQNPQNGQVLGYDSQLNKWKPITISVSGAVLILIHEGLVGSIYQQIFDFFSTKVVVL